MPIIFRHLEEERPQVGRRLRIGQDHASGLKDRGYDLGAHRQDAKKFLIEERNRPRVRGSTALRRALESYVEDPLSEELLQGTFTGKNRINVDVHRDDDGRMKHLKFEGDFIEPPADEKKDEEEPVGVGAADETSEEPEASNE